MHVKKGFVEKIRCSLVPATNENLRIIACEKQKKTSFTTNLEARMIIFDKLWFLSSLSARDFEDDFVQLLSEKVIIFYSTNNCHSRARKLSCIYLLGF